MNNRIFIVEGATSSGKDTLLSALEREGNLVARGIPSQYPLENFRLTTKGRQIMGETELSFKKMIVVSAQELKTLVDKYYTTTIEQHNFVVKTDFEKKIIFMNRSFISMKAHLQMLVNLRSSEQDVVILLEQYLFKIGKQIDKFFNHVNGIILMGAPILGVKISTLKGYETLESEEIKKIVNEMVKKANLRFLTIDANKMTVHEELKKVKKFSGIA